MVKSLDRLLVDALKKGDIDAFDQLFTRYNKKLYYFAKGYLDSKEDAEGLVQEVFIKIWEKREDINEYLSFNSFIFTITYNAILKYFRKKSREKKYMERYLAGFSEKDHKTISEIEYNNLLELTKKAIDKLPEKRKLVFELSRFEGLSNKEISKRLHISKRTVDAHIYNALKFLKEQLGKGTLLTLLFFYLFVQ